MLNQHQIELRCRRITSASRLTALSPRTETTSIRWIFEWIKVYVRDVTRIKKARTIKCMKENSLVWRISWRLIWLLMTLLLLIIHIGAASGVSHVDFSVALLVVKCRHDAVKTICWRCHVGHFQRLISHFMDDGNLRWMLRRRYDDRIVLRRWIGVGKRYRIVRCLDGLCRLRFLCRLCNFVRGIIW